MTGRSVQKRKVLRRKNNGVKNGQPKTNQPRKNRGSRKLIRKSISQRGLKLSRMMIEDDRAKRQMEYEQKASVQSQYADLERERDRLARAQIAAEKAAEARNIAMIRYQDMINAYNLSRK